jgi:hypothetical protein
MDARVSAPSTTHHEIFLTDGAATLRWSMTDSGVTLSDDSLSWAIGGVGLERGYSDISHIRLQRASAGAHDAIGVCQIRFRDGTMLHVYGGGDKGFPDETQAARYNAFVRDLHGRLASRQDTKRIHFQAGISEGRHTVLTVTIIAAGLLFVLLPVVLVLMAGTLHALGVAAAAIALFWSFYKLWDKNRPRAYSPSHVPEDLLS